MRAVVIADRNLGIAQNGRQVLFIPQDLWHFSLLTRGRDVVMGRKTMEALPGRMPLPSRRNFVLTRNRDIAAPEGFEVRRDADALRRERRPGAAGIGGGEIYDLFLGDCDEIFLTHVDADLGADVFFPEFRDDFVLAIASPWEIHKGLPYRFETWHRKNFTQ